MKPGLAIAAIALLAAPTIAKPAAAPAYRLALDYDDGGGLRGSPSLSVRAGEPSRIVSQDAAGNRFAADFTATPRSDGMLDVHVALEMQTDSLQRRATAFAIRVQPGRRTSMTIAAPGGIGNPIRLSVGYQPVR